MSLTPVNVRISEIFGNCTFNLNVMKEKLPKQVFKRFLDIIEKGRKLDAETADAIAHAMKEWALSKGVTHYTHWFQPMTGLTAEKHDAFIQFDSDDHISVIERFSGSQLIQSEPDASSFPSGGMRSTFEARGYTAWDPTSPAFIIERGRGSILCIPSAFISYHGGVLDMKTPLLRSMEAVSKAALRVLKLFGNKSVYRVKSSVGAEQEYFLVDHRHADKRLDIKICGRTLLGARPVKGQEMEDHYFASIKDRVLDFMQDFEFELLKLGVPCKTRHNEVAPHQFEIAPIYEEANIAADHNQLVMETMKRIAKKHDFYALLAEKPFAYVNGSGKHCNWSLIDTDGNNLLDPGQTPEENLQFLVFLMASLMAVEKHGGLLRAAIASAGNDHRLGANEAPPAIMSVFLGEMLSQILDQIESGKVKDAREKSFLDMGISKLPKVSKDQTDRNRTSPFAFTGNKFEFRAVGSSSSISIPVAVLNAAAAESIHELADQIEILTKKTKNFESAVIETVKKAIEKTKKVRFEGNNYSEQWLKEAKSRSLPIAKNTPEALKFWIDKKQNSCLINLGILNEEEIESRYHICFEQYNKTIEIELATMLKMLSRQVLPSAYIYQKEIASSVEAALQLREALNDISPAAAGTDKSSSLEDLDIMPQVKFFKEYAGAVSKLQIAIEHLREVKSELAAEEDLIKKADIIVKKALPAMQSARATADFLETVTDRECWSLPTYSELLFWD
ncbi:MAG TPA: glutamine synthetase III [Candidatus Wallbacteria bacterium]|nr:glutamine synthetase III [Candidatus Wallbacteria bacterium]